VLQVRADDLHRAEYFPALFPAASFVGLARRAFQVGGYTSAGSIAAAMKRKKGGRGGRGEREREREREKSVIGTTAVVGNILAGISAATFISNCVST